MKVISPQLKLNVRGLGRAWPAGDPVTNLDLLRHHPETADKPEAVLAQLDERIQRAFGFRTRRMAQRPWEPPTGAGATSESLALEAARQAVGSAGAAVDAFILGTTTSRRYTGSQAAAVMGALGGGAAAWEVKAGCSTSLASLHLAFALLGQGPGNVLVACAETLSRVVNPGLRETWFGLADGAAALWLERADGPTAQLEIVRATYGTAGQHVDLYTTPGDLPPRREVLEAGGYFLAGDSSELKALAKVRYLEALDALLPDRAERRALTHIVSHQVNRHLTDEVVREAGLGGQLSWSAVEHGNLGGASVLFTLVELLESGALRSGDTLLLMSVGGGLSFAAQLWRVP